MVRLGKFIAGDDTGCPDVQEGHRGQGWRCHPSEGFVGEQVKPGVGVPPLAKAASVAVPVGLSFTKSSLKGGCDSPTHMLCDSV